MVQNEVSCFLPRKIRCGATNNTGGLLALGKHLIRAAFPVFVVVEQEVSHGSLWCNKQQKRRFCSDKHLIRAALLVCTELMNMAVQGINAYIENLKPSGGNVVSSNPNLGKVTRIENWSQHVPAKKRSFREYARYSTKKMRRWKRTAAEGGWRKTITFVCMTFDTFFDVMAPVRWNPQNTCAERCSRRPEYNGDYNTHIHVHTNHPNPNPNEY